MKMAWLTVLCVIPLLLSCGMIPLAPLSSQWEGSSPRVICPTPTALPTTTPYQYEMWVVNELGTPTRVIEEVPPSRPYEREYGIPITPTTYARTGTVFVFGDIVQIQPNISMRITAPPPVYHQQRSDLIIVVETEATMEYHIVPALQIGVSSLRLADGQYVSGFWSPVTLPLTDDPDQDGVVQIPQGRSRWEWIVSIADPQAVVEAIDFRLSLSEDARFPSASVRWMNRQVVDPYCPNWQGIWSPQTDATAVALHPTKPPSDVRQRAVTAALSQLGRPYCFGGKGWNVCPAQCFSGRCYGGCTRQDQFPCWDCSGLVHYAWMQAGVTIPHGSMNQATAVYRRELSELQPGDLLFFWGDSATGRRSIAHVALYVGDVTGDGTGDLVHASWYGTPVSVVNNWYNSGHLRRIFAFAGSPIRE